jgi:alpha/beta superfamily hydrolase
MEQRYIFQGGNGLKLEGRLTAGRGARAGLAVCHPHPLYGGDMDNPVVVRAAEVAREAGLATLRFNFRGVGASEGSHDSGAGEQDDARAALAALRAQLGPDAPLGLAGYSFGAWVSARVATAERGLAALCLIAPPLSRFDFAEAASSSLDVLLVAGTRDPYCPAAELARLAGRFGSGQQAVTIDGADHFFAGTIRPLGEAIRSWAARWAPV